MSTSFHNGTCADIGRPEHRNAITSSLQHNQSPAALSLPPQDSDTKQLDNSHFYQPNQQNHETKEADSHNLEYPLIRCSCNQEDAFLHALFAVRPSSPESGDRSFSMMSKSNLRARCVSDQERLRNYNTEYAADHHTDHKGIEFIAEDQSFPMLGKAKLTWSLGGLFLTGSLALPAMVGCGTISVPECREEFEMLYPIPTSFFSSTTTTTSFILASLVWGCCASSIYHLNEHHKYQNKIVATAVVLAVGLGAVLGMEQDLMVLGCLPFAVMAGLFVSACVHSRCSH